MSTQPGETCHSSLIGDRKLNQDRCITIPGQQSLLMGLADGMGGHPKGEVAAQILMDTCENYFARTPQPILNPNSFLTRLLQKAHESIVAFGYEQEPAIDPRTTAVVALIHDGVAHWAHAGDSRLYLLRNKRLLSKTIDHSYVERLRQQGVISAREQKTHPQRNYVTRCLGGNITAPDIALGKHKLEPGDILLLCSDGLWGKTTEQQLLETFFSGLPLEEAVHLLTRQAADAATPTSDNVTLSALRMAPDNSTNAHAPTSSDAERTGESNLAQAIAELQHAINHFENENKEEK
jgi:serine/threonine protein phosphatase PrpC